MLQSLKLVLPVLVPSWRFFNEIAPSPRIEYCLLTKTTDKTTNWVEFRPRPQKISWLDTIKRIFFNPHWNESLYIMNCAEQLIISPSDFHSQEIARRITNDLDKESSDLKKKPYLQFKLVFVSRQGNELQRDTLFVSDLFDLSEEVES